MSSGGKKQETVTNVSQSGPPAWAVPYYQSAINQAGQVASQPYRPYDGARVAGFTDDQNAAMDQTRSLAGNSQGLDSASQFTTGMINGTSGQNPYAGQNPFLDQMIGKAQGDVTDAYTRSTVPNMLSQFNSAGAYGGTAMQDSLSQSQRNLGESLGNVSMGLRSQDYDRQANLAESGLNRQLSAAGLAPQLDQARYYGADKLSQQGAQQQDWLQSLLDTDYGDYVEGRDWNKNQLGVLTNTLAAINGGTVNSSQQSQANPNYRSAGQNAAGYAALLASMWG